MIGNVIERGVTVGEEARSRRVQVCRVVIHYKPVAAAMMSICRRTAARTRRVDAMKPYRYEKISPRLSVLRVAALHATRYNMVALRAR